MVLSANVASAQTSSGGNNYFIYSMVAIAVFLFFYLVVQVSDNLMAIEAKQSGADKTGANFSLFPRIQELFAPSLPEYASNKNVHRLSKGHDILLQGVADKVIDEGVQATTFAVQPVNYRGIAPIPKMLVEVGAEVQAGDALFFDKNDPDTKYVAPVSGEVIAINRGAKRSITEVVILADKDQTYRQVDKVDPETASREELVSYLRETGLWPLINQRPFDVVADPNEVPRDIFISTFDTAPLAPDLELVVAGREASFQKGLDVLSKLTSGKVHLGLNAKGANPPAAVFSDASGVEKHWFHGKHPAGNVGVQIHHIAPLGTQDKVWTLGVQDVISIGEMFLEGKYNVERIVALTGYELNQPKYVRTYLGAKISDLIKDNVKSDKVRLISGDVLSGEKKNIDQFLNAKDDQLTVIEEGNDYELFGWLLPIEPRPSVSNTFPNFLYPDYAFKADTNTHGEKRAFVVTGQYEAVLPMDIYPQHLMKAILTNDFERMEGLGIHEVSEEDIALCEFVCTSKQPLQDILRKGQKMMLEQG
ncbi:NADH:ubiquinone reductase (Na(+)-transporting) subunit A [Flavilitoribacter nigricans DSM 23189 = NBRC 102662]|uniref:Na(+)-translocating NADH-quinone reductase subunit A n=2 Tax=Flavilitoribacter TaxID=2762562 RepID=A0A2D0NE40_FLAN2|nr:NADH:ubiquinone reductase (Na(+)-transporting) subunit A [Flavilitoribacter nigricans DSM 23189 = NBRC 102662]